MASGLKMLASGLHMEASGSPTSQHPDNHIKLTREGRLELWALDRSRYCHFVVPIAREHAYHRAGHDVQSLGQGG